MLKALELAGFKSFADKTRFDFPDGITVVVGPNGSGKSNIVDAMKWVLGSQSAKALRGKEMADVIFKGSQTRSPAAAAEVSIIFDNTGGELPYEATEVSVGRRVYRSGETEYLINGSAVRLKDVRDLIRGTGIGIDAYSLIEQGKVDRMLNANARDRRAIFEEAAGISRFKAKKIEAERRLARVQTNLNRLGDIVDEVGTRLKTLRAQAGKAEKYQQASTRLRDLRVQLAWTDWIDLSSSSDRLGDALTDARAKVTRFESAVAELRDARDRAESEIESLREQTRVVETDRMSVTTRLASLRGRHEADLGVRDDLIATRNRQLGELRATRRAVRTAAATCDDAERRVRSVADEESVVRGRAEAARTRQAAAAAEVAAASRAIADLRQQQDDQRGRRVEYESELTRTSAAIETARGSLATLSRRVEVAAAARDEAAAAHASAEAELLRCDQQIEAASRGVDTAAGGVTTIRETLRRRNEEIAALRVRLEGIRSRADVLRELEQRREHLGGGVRAVLESIEKDSAAGSGDGLIDGSPDVSPDDSRDERLCGLVADCFQTDVEHAAMIDAALGPLSQYIVTRGDDLQRAVAEGKLSVGSRVGFIRLDELPARRSGDRIQLDGLRGVIVRADRCVTSDAAMEPLVRHLLSTTWFVETLDVALGLRKLSGAGLRFVTRRHELLEIDGSVVVGPATDATGLVSRRSELSRADRDIETYEHQIADGTAEIERLESSLDEAAAALGRAEAEHRHLVTHRAAVAAEHKHAATRLREQSAVVDDLHQQTAATESDLADAESRREQLETDLAELNRSAETLGDRLAESEEALGEAEAAAAVAGEGMMRINVDVARIEQSHAAARREAEAAASARDAAGRALSAAEDARRDIAERLSDLQHRLVDTGDRIADAAADAGRLSAELVDLTEQSVRVAADNRDVLRAADQAAQGVATWTAKVNELTNQTENASLRRQSVAERLMEDYEIDLRTEEVPLDHAPPENRDDVEAEITRLRGQLQRTSGVNMEALEELQELQDRYDNLHGQYQDLTAAKESLARIIHKINADSRRLFTDTLEAIRVNFQQLYRKSFGGGHADLVLEESDDPNEAGVEIVATPPGKQSLNNSLLSGGEKALTAVALLMAIFKYRPSPFCVLDEVDAPFDEANIGRFVTVLREFLDQSKFVVVTHSKKTMTAATTLYGVTMQESGVSKRVSIRFEDVTDDGDLAVA